MDNKRVGIIGFGRTGKALLSFLLSGGDASEILVFDDHPEDISEFTGGTGDIPVEMVSGDRGIRLLAECGLVILSPGVNGREERFTPLRKSGARVISGMEFASSFAGSAIIAVTGTNGKSTTVSLIHHILKTAGIDSWLAGNIGVPLIAEVDKIDDNSITVLEVSSFQLEEIDRFKPEVTAILNITPDHLDRYPDLRDYIDAKLNILKNLTPDDPVIFNYDDPYLRDRFHTRGEGKFRKVWFSLEPGEYEEGAWLEGNEVVIRTLGNQVRLSLEGNPLIGSHNLENILASVLAVSLAGISLNRFPEALNSFRGLSHRMEVCGTKDGVRFINDSKATNVEATVKSIRGIEDNIALILGGKDKGGDFSQINEFIGGKVKEIILIGEAAGAISAALNSDKIFTRAHTLDEALRKGFEVLAGGGGTVLLAPGCASFDMFSNYEERGDVFKQGVEKFIKGI